MAVRSARTAGTSCATSISSRTSLSVQLPAESLRRLGNEGSRVEGFERIHLGHVGHARIREQVVHEPRQTTLLAHEHVRVAVEVLVGLDAASHQGLSDCPYRGERRFQFVRDGGDEVGAHGRDGGARPCRAGRCEKTERQQRDARADHDEASPCAARREHEVGSPAALAATVQDRCARSAGGSTATSVGSKKRTGKVRVATALAPNGVERAGDAAAAVVAHRKGGGAGVSGDLRHLLQDVVEIVAARPLQIDGTPNTRSSRSRVMPS